MMCGPTEEIHPFVMESASWKSKRQPMQRKSLIEIEDKVLKCIRIGKVGTFILLAMGMLGCIYFLGVVLGNVIIETMSTDETFSSSSSAAAAAVPALSGEYTAEEEEFVNLLSESSFVRDKVSDLVVKEYVATSSDWYTLDTAMDALDKLENDAEPVEIVDHDFMFVGSVGKYRLRCASIILFYNKLCVCVFYVSLYSLCMRESNKSLFTYQYHYHDKEHH